MLPIPKDETFEIDSSGWSFESQSVEYDEASVDDEIAAQNTEAFKYADSGDVEQVPEQPDDDPSGGSRPEEGDPFAQDADKWITVHPNGKDTKGTPALIGENGEVKGGMGGKFNGQNIKDAHGTVKFTSGETNAETEARHEASKPKDQPAKPSRSKSYIDSMKAKGLTVAQIAEKEQATIAKHEATLLSDPKNKEALGSLKGAYANMQALHEELGNTEGAQQAAAKSEEYSKRHAELKGIQSIATTQTTQPKQESAKTEAKPMPQSPTFTGELPQGHERAYHDERDYSIVKETESAYGIPNPNYQGSGYYAQHRWAKGENIDFNPYIWVPKSQVTVSGEGVARKIESMSGWFAQKSGLDTHESIERERQRVETESAIEGAASKRYNDLVDHAKANGLSSVRKGMRTSTILDKMKEAGIEAPASHGGAAESAPKEAGAPKYHAIPGRGNGALLNVPFADKEEAKALGARWSPDLKKWYVPEGVDYHENLKKWALDGAMAMDSIYSDYESQILDAENEA